MLQSFEPNQCFDWMQITQCRKICISRFVKLLYTWRHRTAAILQKKHIDAFYFHTFKQPESTVTMQLHRLCPHMFSPKPLGSRPEQIHQPRSSSDTISDVVKGQFHTGPFHCVNEEQATLS